MIRYIRIDFQRTLSVEVVSSRQARMKSNIDVVIIALAATMIICVRTQILFPSTGFIVTRSSGIINFIQIAENSREFGSTCRLHISADPAAITIDLNEFLLAPYKLETAEQIKKTSSDLCGVRMYPISEKMDALEIVLIMEYVNGTSIDIPFTITVIDKIENISPVNISYALTSGYELPYIPIYHEFEDEFGKLFQQSTIGFDQSYNSDKWVGRGLARFQMDEIKTIYNLFEDDSIPNTYTKLTTIETVQSHIFQCDADWKSYSGVCYARKPDGSIINIETGLATDKYTSYDTQIKNGLCSIEILKPFDEIDKGIWQIVFPSLTTGCIFLVDGDNEKKKRIAYLESTANSPIQLDIDVSPTRSGTTETVTIKCEYPGEIDYCILQKPDGSIEVGDDFNMGRTSVLGYCVYTVNPISGRWVCSIKTRGSDILNTIHYQMNTYNNSYITSYSMSEQKFLAESVELMCQSRFKYKLEYCIFESPDGVWYNFSEKNRNKIARITYAGRGLRYGDCGIAITNIQQEDFGNWTCHIKINTPNSAFKHHNRIITLIEDAVVSSAVIMGVGIAFGIIILGVITRYTYIRYRTRRNNNLNNSEIEIE